jgi:predicted DNA-binding protein (MmcQ/YjbR family)
MNAERAREFLLTLPHVCETRQWGDNLLFWTGDKAIGGKMFCLLNLDPSGGVISFAAGEERFYELVERDGLYPAPYMARIFWVAAEGWGALRNTEWEELLRAAHAMVFARLPPRTRAVLEMPARTREKLVRERRALLEKRCAITQKAKAITQKAKAAEKSAKAAKTATVKAKKTKSAA